MVLAQQKVQFLGGPLDGEWRRLDLPLPPWFHTDEDPATRYGLVSPKNGRQSYVLAQLLPTPAD